MERRGPSVVEDQGPYASSCGYCKSNARTSVAYGLWAHTLTVSDYQDLLDRGWRRSGMFLYKPEMEKTCCPAYTIRIKADSFIASKEQMRVMRRMQRYLDGTYHGPLTIGELHKESNVVPERLMGSRSEDAYPSISSRTAGTNDMDVDCYEKSGVHCETKKEKWNLMETEDVARDLSLAVEAVIKSCILSGELPAGLEIPKIVVQRVQQTLKRRLKGLNGDLHYTCNIAFPTAASLKRINTHKKEMDATRESDRQPEALDESIQGASPVVLAELLASKFQSYGLHNLKVEACKGHLNFLSLDYASSDTAKFHHYTNTGGEFDSRNWGAVEDKGGPSISSTKAGHLSSPRTGHMQVKHKLEIRMRRSAFDPEEFALYKRYQIAVHHDRPEDVKESSYRKFLVDSPLIFVPPSEDGTSFCGFGSFHQQYLIDGRLVAVGVVDILPSCLSSKYLFWDPDLAFLSLGKYSALQEIMWVEEARKHCPKLEFYYLGYYIHSCAKMRYKAAYFPSELLCPVRFQWVSVHIARPLLDNQHYVCLSDYLDGTAVPSSTKDLNNTKENAHTLLDENECSDEPRDMDLGEVESPRRIEVIQNVEVASSSKESEDVSNILLKLGEQYLRFKHLQALRAVPRKRMDALARHLRKYSQVVGPALASRMAYILG